MQRLLVFLAGFWMAAASWAQGYPERTVHMIVPFPAGGPLDVVARMFGEKMSGLGRPFIVENRPGAAGNLGLEVAAKAAPDGYTLLWALDAMLTVNTILYPKLEPFRKLRPVAALVQSTSALVVPASLEARTVAEFIKLSHARNLHYASAGNGSPGHRFMEFFKLETGARAEHVPYKGNAPGVQSVVAGETQAFISPIAGVLSYVRSGKLRPLAVTSPQRSSLLPEVPTMVELGFPRVQAVNWYAVLVPRETPDPIVQALNRELGRIARLPEMQSGLARQGLEAYFDGPEAVVDRARTDGKLWAEVIRRSGMRVE